MELVAIMALAHPAMTLWLGPDIGTQAGEVLQILAVGVFLNALAQGPATLIQAAGRPRDIVKVKASYTGQYLDLPAEIAA